MPSFLKISILIVILLVVIFVLLKIITVYKNEMTEKLSKLLEKKIKNLFFNDIIQSLLVNYLSYSLYSSNLIKNQIYSAGIILAIVLILIPIAIGQFLRSNFNELDTKYMRTKFEKLYENIVVGMGLKLKVLYYPWFLLKRYFLVLIPLLF